MLTPFQFTLLQLLKEKGPLTVEEIVLQMGETDTLSVEDAIESIGIDLIAQNGETYHAINQSGNFSK